MTGRNSIKRRDKRNKIKGTPSRNNIKGNTGNNNIIMGRLVRISSMGRLVRITLDIEVGIIKFNLKRTGHYKSIYYDFYSKYK